MKNSILLRNCITLLLLLTLPAVVQAQFTLITNDNDWITITRYTGPGGAVVIPSTTNGYAVTIIGNNAFAYCTNLTSVVIPDSVTNIGIEPFLGCASLTNISVDSGNPSYSSLNGVLFDAPQETLIDYPAGMTSTTYTFPSSVTNIGQYAFASCFNLTNVFIPYNVTVIGQFAFYDCAEVTSVTITNRVFGGGWQGPTSIGAGAFTLCTSLTNVFVASTVTNVGGLAFALCTNLTSAYFQSNAPPDFGNTFYGDPDAVVYYVLGTTGWGATFGGAPAMGETSVSEFEYETLNGSITITGYTGPVGPVVIPGFINGYPVTSIGTLSSLNVTSITIPDTVTNIGDGAFQSCQSLTSITVPGSVISIGLEAFQNCTGLTSVTIANGVINIGDSAFQSCTQLTSIMIPSSVTNIEGFAFASCTGLTSAYFEGNAPPDFGNAFENDPATVYYLPGTTGWGATFGGVPTELWNPQATALTTADKQFAFNITGPANATVVVQACTNLARPVWLPVSTNTLSGSTSSFSDPQWTNFPNRYYRFSGL